jgi:hypothetical protein
MKLPHRRKFLHLVAGAAALPAASPRVARAQAYPTQPVRFIVPFPPGGSADPIARVLSNRLSEIWGQQVVIENKGGAGGNLGAQTTATAAPDGYNIFFGGAFMAKNRFVSGIGLRSSHGFGASGQSLRIQQHYGRSQFIPGEVGPGIHRSRQRQSRQGYLRFVRYWCRPVHEHRAVSEAHRHRDDARAVPRRRTGARRR